MFARKKKTINATAPRELIVEKSPKSSISEQFRTIRTNITYSRAENPIRTVLFTSAIPDAGKSTVAANLAITYAQTGVRTLLIDADLRRPTTHYTFEVTNQRGLSTAIVKDMTAESIVKETEIDNLNIVTSGPIPPNPSELLSSRKMHQLLKTFSMDYDMVLIDSPPLLAVTDAQVISKMVDGTMIITNVAENDRDHLKEAKGLLEKVESNILGVVLNNKKNAGRKGDYYYYYGRDQQ